MRITLPSKHEQTRVKELICKLFPGTKIVAYRNNSAAHWHDQSIINSRGVYNGEFPVRFIVEVELSEQDQALLRLAL